MTGNGSRFGIKLTYQSQEKPQNIRGLQVVRFYKNSNVALILTTFFVDKDFRSYL